MSRSRTDPPRTGRGTSFSEGKELTVINGRYRVVLAHDADHQRAALSMALHASGWFEVVGEATTGVDLLAQVTAFQPDAVLVRLLLPKGNGLAVLPDLLDLSPDSVVGLLSVTPSTELEGIACARGADLCLEESLPADRVVAHLLRMMSKTEWLRCVPGPCGPA